MTRKARLQAWAAQLNVPVSVDATVAQVEQAIEDALACSQTEAPAPQYSFRDAVANNARVLRQELPGAAKAIASNLFS